MEHGDTLFSLTFLLLLRVKKIVIKSETTFLIAMSFNRYIITVIKKKKQFQTHVSTNALLHKCGRTTQTIG